MRQQKLKVDANALRCERCGYVVEGLDPDAVCPECASPICKSLPQHRSGTPWQRQPGKVSLIHTAWRTLARPLRTLDEMQPVQPRRRFGMRRVYLLLAAVLPYTLMFLFLKQHMQGYRDAGTFQLMRSYELKQIGRIVIGFPVFTLATWLGLELLNRVVSHAMAVLSRWTGGHVSPRTARTVLDHGSVWLLAGSAGFSLCFLLRVLTDSSLREHAVWFTRIAFVAPYVGLLGFGVFAALGLRRLKYANTRSPDASATAENPVAGAPGSLRSDEIANRAGSGPLRSEP